MYTTPLRLWGIIWVLCSLVFSLQNKKLYWLLAAVTSYREAGFVLAHGLEGCSPLWWEGIVTPARKRRKGNASAQLAFAFSSYIPLETLAHRITCHLIESGSPAVKSLGTSPKHTESHHVGREDELSQQCCFICAFLLSTYISGHQILLIPQTSWFDLC